MGLEDLDVSNCEIRFSQVVNVFQGKLSNEKRVTIYDKLTDEEFIVDPHDELLTHIILMASPSNLEEE